MNLKFWKSKKEKVISQPTHRVDDASDDLPTTILLTNMVINSGNDSANSGSGYNAYEGGSGGGGGADSSYCNDSSSSNDSSSYDSGSSSCDSSSSSSD